MKDEQPPNQEIVERLLADLNQQTKGIIPSHGPAAQEAVESGVLDPTVVRIRGEFHQVGELRESLEFCSPQYRRQHVDHFREFISGIRQYLASYPEEVWCFKGSPQEVRALASAFRAQAYRKAFEIKTRNFNTELYVLRRRINSYHEGYRAANAWVQASRLNSTIAPWAAKADQFFKDQPANRGRYELPREAICTAAELRREFGAAFDFGGEWGFARGWFSEVSRLWEDLERKSGRRTQALWPGR